MSEIKPRHLWCEHNLTALISEHPKVPTLCLRTENKQGLFD